MKYPATNYFRRRDEMPWKVDALCAKLPTELFYPGRGESAEPAKAFCAECPVTKQCRDYALDNGELWGVWGGTSEWERKQIRSRRYRATRSEPTHGIAAYRRGCHCEVCTAANRARMRKVRAG